jgi:hypothetical protein
MGLSDGVVGAKMDLCYYRCQTDSRYL